MHHGNKKPVNLQLPILHPFEILLLQEYSQEDQIYSLHLSMGDGHNLYFCFSLK